MLVKEKKNIKFSINVVFLVVAKYVLILYSGFLRMVVSCFFFVLLSPSELSSIYSQAIEGDVGYRSLVVSHYRVAMGSLN